MTGTRACVSRGIVGLLLSLGLMVEARAQSVELGGRAFIDYYYQLSSPGDEEEGLHGFRYRRLYLTADASLSDDFRSRARLEANDETSGAKGPVPYVKDLWVEWNYSGDHTATLGVMRPPVYDLAEDVWGYRSLEKMVLDFQGVNSSRDFGLRMDGPLTASGVLRYHFMVANNSAAQPESDVYKRGYAMLSVHPGERFLFYGSADYAGYGDDREKGKRVSVFGGYDADDLRVGLEVYWSAVDFGLSESELNRGVSMFGAFRVTPRTEVLARLDVSEEKLLTSTIESMERRLVAETFFMTGITYAPNDHVRITPNFRVFDANDSDDADALGRITVDVSF